MNTKLLIAGSIRLMTRYKLRTFFMSVGIVLGVATLVVTRSLGDGAERAMLEKVNRMFGPSSILIRSGGARSSSRGGLAESSRISTFRIADLKAIGERLDQIAAWDPMLVLGGREVKYRGTSRQVTIWGHSEHADVVWNRGVIEGRSFTAGDLASAARIALIGTRVAMTLFGQESPIGQQILIDSAPFRVVGVLESIGIDPHGMDRDEDVHVPTTTIMRRLLNVDYIEMAKLIVRDPAAVEETAEQIEKILRERHQIVASEPSDFAIITPIFVQRMIARLNRVLKTFLPAAAGVALLVAAFVIASIMLIAVRERITEVGLRKAVGATEQQIVFQFLLEAIAVTLCSGIVGIALGLAVAIVVSQSFQMPVLITIDTILIGLVASLLVGVLSGFLPARHAARLDPVAALR